MLENRRVHDREVKVFKDRPHTVGELFFSSLTKYPDKEVIVTENDRETYKEMGDKVSTIATNLKKEFGVKKGDRVSLLLSNRPEFIHVTVACSLIGAVIVPLNTRLSSQELKYMINHSESKILISEDEFIDSVLSIRDELSIDLSLIFTNAEGSNRGFQNAFTLYTGELPLCSEWETSVNEEDPFFIMYTSGTTGQPKGAIGSHLSVVHSALSYKEVMKTNNSAKTLIAVPLFHVTGFIGQLIHMLLVGGTSVIMPRYQTEKYIKLLHREKATFLFNVPTIYIMLLSHPLFKKYTFDFVETIAYGGAPMSYETIQRLRGAIPGVRLHNAYGATETSSPTTIMPVKYSDDKLGSVGLPVPGGEVKVVNDEMEELPLGEVGELLIKGPMVVKGYWKNEEDNKASFINGFWKSGDMARIDHEGYVYIMDRKKDMINRGGEKVFSAEVENILYGHPNVLEAAVVGVPDRLFGERVKAYIVPKEKTLPKEDYQTYLSGRLADYKVPSEIETIDQLPRNPGGKVLKNRLSKMESSQVSEG